jgi:hypothetical protein
MIVDLTDPADATVRGSMSSPDPINFDDVLAGGFFNLELSNTLSSEDVATLFDLQPPPTFSGPFMVSAALDDTGALTMFLSPTTGDTTHAFATLDGFRSFVDGSGTTSGAGTLTRSNKLPPDINWGVSP